MKNVFLLCSYICLGSAVTSGAEKPLHPFSTAYLEELLDDLYYWNVDASSYFAHDTDAFIEVEIAPATPAEGAVVTGEWWNIIIPDLALHVDVAKRNETHADLGITVTNETYKILSVVPTSHERGREGKYHTEYLDEEKVYRKLARAFHTHDRPPTQLVSRLTRALRWVVRAEEPSCPEEVQRFHVAPPSHLRNTIWIFWENKDVLIRFLSATSWKSPGFWEHIPLFTKIYDLRTDVIVSSREQAGSNAYITREWAGRILCNCLVHGMVIRIPPAQTPSSSE